MNTTNGVVGEILDDYPPLPSPGPSSTSKQNNTSEGEEMKSLPSSNSTQATDEHHRGHCHSILTSIRHGKVQNIIIDPTGKYAIALTDSAFVVSHVPVAICFDVCKAHIVWML